MSPHVFIATPCYGGLVTQTYMQSVLSLVVSAHQIKTEFTLGLLGQDALITRSRNTLVAQFLRSKATHLLFVDADIGFGVNDVMRLVSSGRHVVGGLYPLRATRWDDRSLARVRGGEPLASAGLDYVGEPFGEPNEDGFVQAKYAGTGFLLISRYAFTEMIDKYPETLCQHAHVASQDGPFHVHALFDCLIDPDTGHYLSEDYAFCSRWRRIRGEIWLDTRSELSHCGMSEFVGNPIARWRG